MRSFSCWRATRVRARPLSPPLDTPRLTPWVLPVPPQLTPGTPAFSCAQRLVPTCETRRTSAWLSRSLPAGRAGAVDSCRWDAWWLVGCPDPKVAPLLPLTNSRLESYLWEPEASFGPSKSKILFISLTISPIHGLSPCNFFFFNLKTSV